MPNSWRLLPCLAEQVDEEWWGHRDWLARAPVLRLRVPAGHALLLSPNLVHFQWFPVREPIPELVDARPALAHLSLQCTLENVAAAGVGATFDTERVRLAVSGAISGLRAGKLRHWPGREPGAELPPRRGPHHLAYVGKDPALYKLREDEERMLWGGPDARHAYLFQSPVKNAGANPTPSSSPNRSAAQTELAEANPDRQAAPSQSASTSKKHPRQDNSLPAAKRQRVHSQ